MGDRQALPEGRKGFALPTPPFSFRCAEKKSAVDGGKEKGAFPDEQGESWPLNQVFSGFRRNESAPYSWPRAFRSAKRYLVGTSSISLASASGESSLIPLRLLSPPDPLRWAPAGAPSIPYRTGRYCQEAAQVSEAAEGNENTGSASAGNSAEAVPQPRAADNCRSARMTVPVKIGGS